MQKKSILLKLAKRIRQLRKLNKMTQEQLAEKANLHFTYIGEIERTEKNPTITTLEKIAKAFNISLIKLLAFPDDKKIVESNVDVLNKALKLLELARELGKTYEVEKK